MTHAYFETNGIRLHCAVQEPPRAPLQGTILLLHGFPEYWGSWKRIMPLLAGEHRVVAPDLRGYNLSDKPEGVANYGIRPLVADIAGLVQSIGGEPVYLVGHDWGGALAWVMAAYHPHLVRKLVIMNGPHPSTYTRAILHDPAQIAGAQYVHRLRREGAEASLSREGYAPLLRLVFDTMVDGSRFTAEDRAEYVQAWSQPGALTAMLNYYRAMPNVPPMPGELPDSAAKIPNLRVRVPTLVIWGEQDKAVLASTLNGLDEYVPDLRVHRIANATHWVQHDAPDEVASSVLSFVSARL